MGKKSKIGRQRRDKYYQLAKETGYRSRAAFKLIQLNRKFEFLQKSQVCVDLCAAPGGWMQVAKQNMPLSSIVVGIDLFPIKPISGCLALTHDITTDECRASLTKTLTGVKADVVLHDGAPNVGRSWLHDAYQQTCLTLSSLRLATQFLKKGGWFITKVFRSKDYHALIWVLKQLFKKVHATKPQASRNESAEIFVVCQYYLAPAKIDPKFMDAKYVFEELELEPQNKLNIYHPEKSKKAKAEGYLENDYTTYHELKASEFVKHPTGVELLEAASEIVFDDAIILNHAKTTNEIKECCKDIKVLGRKDLKLLLNWRKSLHGELHKTAEEVEKTEEPAVEVVAKTEEDEDLKELDQQIIDLQSEESKELKRKKKKVQKERKKLNDRLNLKMVLKGDEGPTMVGDNMFELKQVESIKVMNKIVDQTPELLAESDDDDDLKLKSKYLRYNKDEQHLDSSGLYYKDSDSELELESEDDEKEIKEGLGLSDSESEDDGKPKKKSEKKAPHPLITDLDHRNREQKRAHKAELWFERDIFKNLIDEKDEDADLDRMVTEFRNKGAEVIGEEPAVKKNAAKQDETSDYSDSDTDSEYDIEQEMPVPVNNSKKDGFEIVKKENSTKKRKYKLNEEELALGTVMINSKKAKRDIIDGAWNRYTFNDTNLPDWFLQDEERHMKRPEVVPKELVDEYRQQLKECNVKSIKKVIEAKARKKKRTMKKLEKARKKVESIVDSVDVGDREKMKQVRQLYRKAKQTTQKEITYVVAKKHMTAKKVKRPAGVKGHYKVVDPRMKKDLRAQKNKLKTHGRGKKGKKPATGKKSKRN